MTPVLLRHYGRRLAHWLGLGCAVVMTLAFLIPALLLLLGVASR